jgi:hypothetical protein
MPDLRFPLDGVRRITAATRSAATRDPTYAQRELDEIPVGFWLVKDDGVYLLSNGDRTEHDPVYAEGLGPDADYDLVRDAAGGDDFCEFVPVDWADQALRERGTHLAIRLTATSLRLLPAGAPTRSPARR